MLAGDDEAGFVDPLDPLPVRIDQMRAGRVERLKIGVVEAGTFAELAVPRLQLR
jgi:hypothetical protein